MAFNVKASFNAKELAALKPRRMTKGIAKATVRARITSKRDMKSEASKRIRARKRIKVKAVNKATQVVDNRKSNINDMQWGIRMRGDKFRLIDYPNRALKRGGISVAVNKGKRKVLKHAFYATVKSKKKGGGDGPSHLGIFQRRGKKRLHIDEKLASRPVDALLHKGEADGVRERGRKSFIDTTTRLLKAELGKA